MGTDQLDRVPMRDGGRPREAVPISGRTRPPERPTPMTIGLRWPHMGVTLGTAKENPTPYHHIPVVHNAIMGSIAGMGATIVVHPIDVIKIRMQLFPAQRTTLQMLRRVLECEGRRALYAGLTAGLLRQATYTTTRLGVYEMLFNKYKNEQNIIPNRSDRYWIMTAAGIAGAFVGTPSEVALVRMTAEGRKRRSACSPPCSPACKEPPVRGGAVYMLYRMAREEGISGIWRGAIPTLIRSVCVSVSQVSAYAEMRQYLKREQLATGTALHIYATMVSSFVAAILSLPVDIVKTRFQSRSGSMYQLQEVIMTLYRTKGIRYFWHGFTPYYVRLAFHTILAYLIFDQFKKFYIKMEQVLK